MNPYWGATLTSFFPLFFHRMLDLLTGKLAWTDLASDEIQVLVFALISIGAALIGTLLILKRMAMLANALSHTILVGIVIAYLLVGGVGGLSLNLGVVLIASVLCALLTTLLTQVIHRVLKLQEDASIGLVFTTLFALGIVLVTLLTRNAHIGLEVVMGNADALHVNDLKIALWVAGGNLLFVLLLYKEWKLTCFDSGFAKSLGFSPSAFTYLLMLLTSATAITAFRAVGVLLFLTFLVGLPLTGRLLTQSLGKMLLWASGIGLFVSLFTVALSRHLLTVYQMPLSTAGLASCLIGVCFLLAVLARGVLSLTFTKKPG